MTEEFPELSEAGRQEAIVFIEKFKTLFKKAAEEVLGEIYVELMPWIESDSWQNYRNECRSALERRYFGNPKELLRSEELWAKECRLAFFNQFKDELTNARIEHLEEELKKQQDLYREAMNRSW